MLSLHLCVHVKLTERISKVKEHVSLFRRGDLVKVWMAPVQMVNIENWQLHNSENAQAWQ